jgi:hypothetical protein
MNDNEQVKSNDDGFVDAVSAVVLIVIAFGTVVYWLSGM